MKTKFKYITEQDQDYGLEISYQLKRIADAMENIDKKGLEVVR